MNRVNSYNWSRSTPSTLQALLLDISRYNDTAWHIFSRLHRTLDHMAGTFWSSLTASVNALPTSNEFRLLQVFGHVMWFAVRSALAFSSRHLSSLELVGGSKKMKNSCWECCHCFLGDCKGILSAKACSTFLSKFSFERSGPARGNIRPNDQLSLRYRVTRYGSWNLVNCCTFVRDVEFEKACNRCTTLKVTQRRPKWHNSISAALIRGCMPAVSGACNWWEWLAGYRSVRGPHLAQHPGPN